MAEPQAASTKESVGVPDLTGTMVGRFAVRARLGAGGMGEVYRADDTRLKRAVALKRIAPRLRSDPHFRQRFLKEAERASQLSHHHLAGIYDVLEENEETFLVMEYVEGETLRERLGTPFKVGDFVPVAIQCAEALVAAHEKGVVHRDIKPENIMVTPQGEVKILDFGVAKRLPRPDTETSSADTASGAGRLGGTPAYMAPEVLLESEGDTRADLFSLGVVFYEALAGQHPFRGESFMVTCDRILHQEPLPLGQLNPQAPEQLECLVSKMLAKDPMRRPASASAVLAELRSLERAEARPSLLPGRLPRAWRLYGSVAFALLVISALVLLALIPGVREPLQRRLGIVPVPAKKNLAVLPFDVLGGTAETISFANGLTETLNARLTQISERHPVQVVPAGEVRAQNVRTLSDARREFGVNLVVQGSLQQAGEVVRIRYALVDARNRQQLRADTITATMADPFTVEDRVVASLLENLEVELQPAEQRAIARRGTRHPGAYDDYLRGRGYLQEYHKPENIESAIALFQRAQAQDPQYAPAYAGLGEAYWKRFEETHDAQWVEKASVACERAVALDASLASGHDCLGVVYNGTGKYEQAVERFRRAVELEPTSDDGYRGLATAYQHLGKLGEAEETYRRAITLRPEYWAGYNWLGNFYFLAGRYREAEPMFEKVIELAPENPRGYENVGVTHYMLGSWAEAEQAYKKSVALRESGETYSNLGTLYFFRGRYADAARMFEAGVRLSPKNPFVRGNLADAYRWIPGEAKKAEESFRQAIDLGEQELRVNPRDAEVVANLALWRAKTGSPAKAVRDIEKALASAPADPRYMYYGAIVYKLAGNRPRALEWLKKSVAHGYLLREIRADPEMRDLHADPAFQRILETAHE